MSTIEKIIEGIDTVSIAIDKYNNMCDELVVSLTNNGETLYFNKFNNDFFSVNIEKDLIIEVNSLTDLNILKSSNNLLTGYYYKFPFQTIFTIPNTSTILTGTTEEFLILATSNNTTSSNVISLTYPNDELYFETTSDRILYRKNITNNISTPYDFRTIKFRRWKLEYSGYTNWASATTYNYGDIVNNNSNTYINIVQHISSNLFDSTYWVVLPTNYIATSTSGFSILGTTIPVKLYDYQDIYSVDLNSKNINIDVDCGSSYFDIPNIVITGSTSNNILINGNSNNITIYDSYKVNVETESTNIFINNSPITNIIIGNSIIVNNQSLSNKDSNTFIYCSNIITYNTDNNYLINTESVGLNNTSKNLLFNNEYSTFSNFTSNVIFSSEYINTIGTNNNNLIYPDCDYLTLNNNTYNTYYQGVNNCYIKGSYNTIYQNCSNLDFSGNMNIFWGNNSFIKTNRNSTVTYSQFGLNVSNFGLNTGSTFNVSNFILSLPNKDLVNVDLNSSISKYNYKNYLVPTDLTGTTYTLWYPQISSDGTINYPHDNLF
jgi:hypothetical protein